MRSESSKPASCTAELHWVPPTNTLAPDKPKLSPVSVMGMPPKRLHSTVVEPLFVQPETNIKRTEHRARHHNDNKNTTNKEERTRGQEKQIPVEIVAFLYETNNAGLDNKLAEKTVTATL